MKVSVDPKLCVGQGMCALHAPAVFTLNDEDGHSEAIAGDVPGEEKESVRQAARACPEQAITVTD